MTSELTGLRAGPARPEHARGLVALFQRADVPCHCRYWHFPGDTNAWLDRCANAAGVNAAEMTERLTAGSDEMSGVVAELGGDVVGWAKVAPAEALGKVYGQRLYRRLPCFEGSRDGVFTIACTLVDPARRRLGIAHALVDAAVALARERGARAVEAFPRCGEALRDDELGTGPASSFLRAGFSVVHDFAPYPVLRVVF